MRPLRLPDGVPDGAEVFRLELDLEAPLSAADLLVLSAEEGARAWRYHRHADRVRFVRTRATLRRLLGERLRLEPAAVRLATNHHGKPRLHVACAAEPALHFNVAHAGGQALIALSPRGAIGVDIERRELGRGHGMDLPALAAQLLSHRELDAGAAGRPDFFDCWSAKEAVLKALGVGVAQHLRQLSVLLPPAAADRAPDPHYRLHSEHAAWPPLAACRLPAPRGYAAALAWTQPRNHHE